jgi:predicted dehydrogenase
MERTLWANQLDFSGLMPDVTRSFNRRLPMKKVRLGIIGVGGMGTCHAQQVLEGKIGRCELTAVFDTRPQQLAQFSDKIRKFDDSRKLIRSGEVDAVLIATPHYDHTTIGIDALQQGLHVLIEKPISVHKADCQRLIAAHKSRKQVFAAMFQMRTVPQYKKVKELVANGTLGKLTRVNWIITDWFRPESYYAMGAWRATWAGEGGGVLLNQCPHNLDLLQWICGMPKRVRAFCGIGKRHNIEVEDEVTAYLEFANGATGVFVTTTGEAPGTNRLEIAGDNGKLVVEAGKVAFIRNEIPATEFSRTSKQPFSLPPVWYIDIPANGAGGQHIEIKQNFVDAILDGAPLIAPAREGINSVELANAMLYSSMTEKTVDMPLNAAAYEKLLKRLIKGSKFVKKPAQGSKNLDMKASFRAT